MCLTALLLASSALATAATDKPNILVIWGDDIGMWNISAYHRGMLGNRTPNIDRIAAEGALYTDYYAEQSCTAGRSSFITGQHPFRTGLLKVGMPGATIGLSGKDPAFHQRFAPRGVIHSYADGRIEDTGPLTRKRMETADQEFTDAALKFMEKAHKKEQPFFVWFNSTRMHVWTRLAPKWQGSSGYGLYADGMNEHDYHVGQLLDKLDELGIADNTLVVYSTDNGSQTNTYPDGGSEPFRGEKGSTWEGGFRVPAMVRWPGVVEPNSIINDVTHHMDWLPTFLAAAGDADIDSKLKKGHRVGDMVYKVHLDGYDQTTRLKGEGPHSRETVFFFDDNAKLNALRWRDWKIHFATMPIGWSGPLEKHNFPTAMNLRTDPFETSMDSALYARWMADNLWLFVPMQQVAGQWLGTYREFPPRQATASFTIDKILQQMQLQVEMSKRAAAQSGQ